MSILESGMTSFAPERKAPLWLIKVVTGDPANGIKPLLGILYREAKSRRRPNTDPNMGFDCWGFVWYYESLAGLQLPLDGYEAEKQFVEVKYYQAQWRDIVIYKSPLLRVPHCGVMENEHTMIHCFGGVDSERKNIKTEWGRVARSQINYPPWRGNIKILRHKSLI